MVLAIISCILSETERKEDVLTSRPPTSGGLKAAVSSVVSDCGPGEAAAPDPRPVERLGSVAATRPASRAVAGLQAGRGRH